MSGECLINVCNAPVEKSFHFKKQEVIKNELKTKKIVKKRID